MKLNSFGDYMIVILVILFCASCTENLNNQVITSVIPKINTGFSYDFFYPEGEGMMDIFSIRVDSGKISSVVGAFPTTEFTFETEDFPQDSLNRYLLYKITSGFETFSDQEYYLTSKKAKYLVDIVPQEESINMTMTSPIL